MDLGINRLILFSCIMDFGKGSKVMKLAKRLGAKGGTIFLGKGTIRHELLNKLGVLQTRKEIFITVIDEGLEDNFYKEISEEFDLHKPNHGIAFSMPLKNCVDLVEGSQETDTMYSQNSVGNGVNNVGYEAIFVIVDKGLSDKVLDSAESAGSTGGTIIHGRGSGTRQKERLFNIEIEPEKDIILILSKKAKTKEITEAIKLGLNIDKPGAGIIFVLDVSKTLGLYGG